MEKNEKKKKPKYNMWQNTQYMLRMACKSHLPSVIVLCLLSGVLQIFSSLTKMLISPVILRYVELSAPMGELLGVIIGFSVLMMAWSGLIAYVEENKQPGRITVRCTIVRDVLYKTCTTSYPNLESQTVIKMKEKAYQTVQGNNEATEEIWNTLSKIVQNIGGFIIYLLMLTAIDPVIIAVTVITAAAGYMSGRYHKNWKYRHREETAEYENKSWYILRKSQDVKLAKDLRIFGMQGWLEDMYDSTMKLYWGYFSRREKIGLAADLLNTLFTFFRNGIAYIYLISITLEEQLPASQFLLYFAAVGGFTTWITGILEGFGKLYEHSLDISSLREYLEIPEPFFFEEGEHITPDSFPVYSLEMRNVSFRYPGAESDTLHSINLKIDPGEKLAVVGLNGAGKTTLVKLLCGFYDPTEGEILLNGRDIRQFNRKDYYSLFSAVFQQFSVLEVTLAENVAQTDENINMEWVKECINKAGLTDRIEGFTRGYDTHIGRWVFEDGIELSGGEMQRLMLARALYKNAPVIILDEPTAALDPLAENDIYQKYNSMTGERTSVYISHRLASTRFCGRIIYLKEGRITESGTHEELLRAGGEYADLFEVQSKYYREGESNGTEK